VPYFDVVVQYPSREGVPPQRVSVWGSGATPQAAQNAARALAESRFAPGPEGSVTVGEGRSDPPPGMSQVIGGPSPSQMGTAGVGQGAVAPFSTAGGAQTLGYDPNYAAKLREEPLFTPFTEQQYGEQFYLDPRRMPGSEIPGTLAVATERDVVDAQIADADARIARQKKLISQSRRSRHLQGTRQQELENLTADRAFYGDQQKKLISQEVPQTRFMQRNIHGVLSEIPGTLSEGTAAGGGPLDNVVSGGIIPDGGGAGFNSNELLTQYGDQVPGMGDFLTRLHATRGAFDTKIGVPDLPPELISAATRQIPITDPTTGELIGYEYQTDPAVAAVVGLYQQRLVDVSSQADRRAEEALANISKDIAASENTANQELAIQSGINAADVARIRADADIAVAKATGASQVDVALAVAERNVDLEDLRLAHELAMAEALQLSAQTVADIEASAVKKVASEDRLARMTEANATRRAAEAQADVAIERINAATTQQADALNYNLEEKKALFATQAAADERMHNERMDESARLAAIDLAGHTERMLEMGNLNQLAIARVDSELKVAQQHGMTAFDVAVMQYGSANEVARLQTRYGLDAEEIRAQSAENIAAATGWNQIQIAEISAEAAGKSAEAQKYAADQQRIADVRQSQAIETAAASQAAGVTGAATAQAGAATQAATTQWEAAKEIATTSGATASQVAQIQADGAAAVAATHGVSADYVADVMAGAQTGIAITQAGATVSAATIAAEVQKYVADVTGTSAENVAAAYAGAQQAVGLAGAAAQVEASRAGLTPDQYMDLSGTLSRGGLPIPERMQLGRIQYTGGLEAQPFREMSETISRGGLSPAEVLQKQRIQSTGGLMPTDFGELQMGLQRGGISAEQLFKQKELEYTGGLAPEDFAAHQMGLQRGGLTPQERLAELSLSTQPQMFSALTGLLGNPSAVGTLQSLGGGFGASPEAAYMQANVPQGATQQMAAGAFPSLSTLPRIPSLASLRNTSEEEKQRQQGFFAGRGVTPSLLQILMRGGTPAGPQPSSMVA
jgi:hypothetical protein